MQNICRKFVRCLFQIFISWLRKWIMYFYHLLLSAMFLSVLSKILTFTSLYWKATYMSVKLSINSYLAQWKGVCTCTLLSMQHLWTFQMKNILIFLSFSKFIPGGIFSHGVKILLKLINWLILKFRKY